MHTADIKYLILVLLAGCALLSPPLAAKTRIYLLAGQSNMMGKTTTSELPVAYRETPPNVTFYYQGREHRLADDSYFGPEVAFAHQLAKALPEDQHIIVKFVASGSYIREWATGQPLYKGMIRQLSLLPLPKHDETAQPTIDAIVWMQGESDCRNTNLANVYGKHLTQLISNLRHDSHSPDSLFIIGAVNPRNEGFPAVDQVRAQQLNVHQAVANTLHIETSDLPTFDNTHFDTNGLLELGKRFADSYLTHPGSRQ